MSRLDALPADQRAVLQLLLKQGKSYGDLAGLLRISDDAVRDRAHQALAGLAGDEGGPSLDATRREEIGDYLLGQQSASQRAGTRAYLEDSAPGRDWAHAVADELEPLAGDALPHIPVAPTQPDETFDTREEASPARAAGKDSAAAPRERSSRLGGVLLLLGLGIAIALVVVLLLGGTDDSKDSGTASTPKASTAAAAADTTSTTGTATTPIDVLQQVNLTPPGGGSKPLGVAQLVAQGDKQALALEAQGLPASTPSSFYAVWLYTSPSKAVRLGFAPPVKTDGKLQAITTAPASLKNYQQLVITAESEKNPAKPGSIVLAGKLKN